MKMVSCHLMMMILSDVNFFSGKKERSRMREREKIGKRLEKQEKEKMEQKMEERERRKKKKEGM